MKRKKACVVINIQLLKEKWCRSDHRNLATLKALSRVFRSSITTVMGPTPPGTGVMKPATCFAPANSTSPTIRLPLFRAASKETEKNMTLKKWPSQVRQKDNCIWKLCEIRRVEWVKSPTGNHVDTAVNHNGSRLDPVGFDKIRPSDGHHQNVRFTHLRNYQNSVHGFYREIIFNDKLPSDYWNK